MAPKERERCLCVLYAGARRPSFALGVHAYWALMEGLEVRELADCVLLAGLYGGIDVVTDGMFVIGETLKMLQKLADKGGPALGSGAVLTTLVGAFRGNPSASVP
jgi:hypothetical protein